MSGFHNLPGEVTMSGN
jgi:hypothetical protein